MNGDWVLRRGGRFAVSYSDLNCLNPLRVKQMQSMRSKIGGHKEGDCSYTQSCVSERRGT